MRATVRGAAPRDCPKLIPTANPNQPLTLRLASQVKDLDMLDDERPLRAGEGGEGGARCLLREHIVSYLELDTSKDFQR
jgi:hypothetical protein